MAQEREVKAKIKDFTPLFEQIVTEHGVIVAAVYGRVWRYTRMSDGVCRASTETIGKELSLSARTVIRHLHTLVSSKYLTDTTPDVVNRPHEYKITGKADLYIQVSAIPDDESRYDNLSEQNTGGMPNCQGRSDKLSGEESIKKDSIKKEKQEEEEAPPPPDPVGIAYFKKILTVKNLNSVQLKELNLLEQTYGTDKFIEMVDWCALREMKKANAIQAMKTAAPNWGQPKKNGRNGNNGNGRGKTEQPGVDWDKLRREYGNG